MEVKELGILNREPREIRERKFKREMTNEEIRMTKE